jgi:hypothetical protein
MQVLDEMHARTVYGPRPIGLVARVLLALTVLIPVLAVFGGAPVMLIFTLVVAILLSLRRPLGRRRISSATGDNVHRADDPLRLGRRTERVVREL